MSTAAAGWWGSEWAIPFGVFCGLVFGIVNGLGVAILRVSSMIFPLGINAVAQGIIVLHTGGFAPQDHAHDLMHWLAVDPALPRLPHADCIWALLGATNLRLA